MRILIVDDNAMNLKLLRAVLEEYGHEVVQALDGEEALTVLNSKPVGAVISDILMPKVDGYRLCYEIRKSRVYGDLPFIVYSSTYNSPADEKLCLDLGADKYLRKPATSFDLLAALGDAIAAPRRKPSVSPDEKVILKEYSERLIEKLEEKNIELEGKSSELEDAHGKLQSVLAYSPAIIYAIEIDGPTVIPTFVSENIERILGVAAPEASYQWWLDTLHPADLDRAKATFLRSVDTGSCSCEYRMRHPNGSYRWIQDTNRIFKEGPARPIKVVGAWVDITSRKLADEALQRTLDEMEQRVRDRTADLAQSNEELLAAKIAADTANRSKSEFLSRMSHELRTPMNSILGFGQLLEYSTLDEGQQDSVNHILRAGRHLLALINEVLEISRIEASSLAVCLEPIFVSDVVGECVSLMEPMALGRGIELIWLDRKPQTAMADRQRVSQVILNLLSNAIKYNVEGGTVTIQVHQDPGGMSVVEVADTGIGIPEEMIGKLFRPFERLGAASTTVEGTGLGLSLSKAFVEEMGGTLSVRSKDGEGSVFSVRLLAGGQDLAQERSNPGPFGEAIFDQELKGRVLAIEDNLMNSQLLTRTFSAYPGVEFTCAMQGRLGLELASDNPPDAILLDLDLPDMHGIDVLRALQSEANLARIPVIVVTADAFADRSEEMLRAGAFRYLTKPFVLRELIEAVAAALLKDGVG